LSAVTGRTFDAFDTPSLSPSGDAITTITRDNYLACGNSNTIFVKRSLLAEIGGFDERLGVGAQTPFQSGEEADLLLRAIERGKQLTYFPDIVVHHDQVDKQITLTHAARAAKYGRGFGALLRKHRFGSFFVLYRLLRPLASAARAMLRGDRAMAYYKWAWLTGIAEGYRTWDRISSGLPFSTNELADSCVDAQPAVQPRLQAGE
jgi:GT2 family glycosyltransferase